jgi:excisionase family DNA binding protein
MQADEIITLATLIGQKLAEKLQENFTVMPTLTLDQVAEQLGVSHENVRKLCLSGQLPYIKIEKLYRIKPADVNAYLNRNYSGHQ